MTIEDPKTNKIGSTPDSSGHGSPGKSQAEVHPPIKGVSILGFSPQSRAEKAGMQKGDVIIEYDGEGNLTTDVLLTLTKMTRPEESRMRAVYLRNGDVFALELAPGSLGISAMDIAVYNPLRDPKVDSEIRTKTSVERIVKFMKSELAEETDKGTLRRTLVQNGWDQDEAVIFIEQIAAEVAKDDKRGHATPEWYKEFTQWMGLIVICYGIWYIFDRRGCIDAVIWPIVNAIVTGAVMIWSVREWIMFRKRLERLKLEKKKIENQALLFKPTKGNLNITDRCRTRQELVWDILIDLRIIIAVIMVVVMVFLLIYGLMFH
jgi:hypothetical protein